MTGGHWQNWSGWVSCAPQSIKEPQTEAELSKAVRHSVGPVRVAGSGHSFTPLVETDGTIIKLDSLNGVGDADLSTREIDIWGGTKIADLGIPLKELGLALANQGDIDQQSITGAIGTGTHGTGRALGSLSTQVASFRLVTATGDVLTCSPTENIDVFKGGRVSLGALGVMSQVRLRCRPAYKLEEHIWPMDANHCLKRLEAFDEANRHFEFFWFPFANHVIAKTLNETDKTAPEPRAPEMRSTRKAENRVFQLACETGRFLPFLKPSLQRYLTSASGEAKRVRWSCEAFPSPRTVLFNEMEFAVPAEKGADCVQEIAAYIQRRNLNVMFPIEFRRVAEDDIWLSPFYERPSVTISVHQYAKQKYRKFFDGCEEIFRSYGGRPHWGKLHSFTAKDFESLYDRWDDFRDMRERLDPDGKFLNPYLKTIFDGGSG